jgi:transcriptional regulator with XRE-family HTH domain
MEKELREWRSINPLSIWLKERQMTMRDFSGLTGISHITISNWIQGLTRPMTTNMMVLSSRMGMRLHNLVSVWDAWEARRPK